MEKLDDFKISDKYISKMTNGEFLQAAIDKGQGQMQALLDISDEVLERYYSVASNLIERQDWVKAIDAFLFLTFLNPYVHNFWICLGMAFQSTSEHDRAIMAYAMGEVTDPSDPVSYANAYQCHLALRDTISAEKCYEKAIELCQDSKWAELNKKLHQLHEQYSEKK